MAVRMIETKSRAVVIALCAAAAAIDGFDTQVVGFTGPLIADELGFAKAQLGLLFSAGILGAALGGFVFGPLADRFGRKRMLVVSCLFFSAFGAATLAATSLNQLMLCRFLTGIGLGGATPCFLGLGVEAAPARHRTSAAGMLYAAYPCGAVLGALMSGPLLDRYGWRGVFMMGAALPLAVAIAIALILDADRPKPGAVVAKGSVRLLLKDGLLPLTLALWSTFFCCFAVIILLSLWMPAIVQQLGVTPRRASTLVAALNIGSVAASLGAGWAISRYGIRRALFPCLILGAMAWPLIGAATAHFPSLLLVTTLAGALVGGLTTGLLALASSAYPSPVRATAIGWAIGFARLGQLALPPLAGGLLAARLDPQLVLSVCGLPLLLALAPLAIVSRYFDGRAIIGATDVGADQPRDSTSTSNGAGRSGIR